jgi:hypothetical protein
MFRAIACMMTLLTCVGAASLEEAPVRLSLRECSLELRATWETLTDTVYGFERKYPLVRDLVPAAERVHYDAGDFRPFLPEKAVAVGDTWRVDARAALPFLRQFHPGATVELHHDSGLGLAAHGGWACLRRLDETHAEVMLRVHAEFLIAGDGNRPNSSWFTPAQFRGRMLIERQEGAVVAFELSVPQQSANVDVNIGDEGGISADIGRIPRMELSGGVFPPSGAGGISEREAEGLLERRFYPFAEIDWLDLAAARAESRATGKPLHVVALFGSLMDESC